MDVQSKNHKILRVQIQHEEMLAAISERNLASGLVTICCETRGMRYRAVTNAKGLCLEIFVVPEAARVHVTEGSIIIADNPNFQPWNIANSGTWQGDACPGGLRP
jgi:hypothetical protein